MEELTPASPPARYVVTTAAEHIVVLIYSDGGLRVGRGVTNPALVSFRSEDGRIRPARTFSFRLGETASIVWRPAATGLPPDSMTTLAVLSIELTDEWASLPDRLPELPIAVAEWADDPVELSGTEEWLTTEPEMNSISGEGQVSGE